MSAEFEPKIIGLVCNWCCYAGADLCGVSRLQYPPYIRLVRVMCSGRVDMKFVVRAFSKGSDGVFIGGCWPGECHYVTEGNYDAMVMVAICKQLLERIGINPQRLRLEWVSASEGVRFAEVMNDFAKVLRKLGPLGKADGERDDGLLLGLEAISRIVPYIKLVERERLRVPAKREELYEKFLQDEKTKEIIQRTIVDRLDSMRIRLLLQKAPLTTGEIAKRLGMSPSEVARHLDELATFGLIRYEAQKKAFALAS
jgi:F420-non-reducing hydrogenase iron-sulfur subunit